jgi:hypothetical protein
MDRPMWQQYFRWISAIVLHGDLGSRCGRARRSPSTCGRLPVTFQLGAIALVVGLIIALPIGIYSAMRQDTAGDYLAPQLLHPAAGRAQLLAGHDGGGVPVDLVGLVARRSTTCAFFTDNPGQPVADGAARHRAGRRAVGQ